MFFFAKEVVLSSVQDYAKPARPVSQNCDAKLGHGSQKKPLDVGGNPDHVMLGLGYGLMGPNDTHDTGFVGRPSHTPQHWVCFIQHLFNCSNIAGSAALVEVWYGIVEFNAPLHTV